MAAKKRQHTQRIAPFEHGQGGKPRIDERRRARYLLSGLTRCGYCGGYAMIFGVAPRFDSVMGSVAALEAIVNRV